MASPKFPRLDGYTLNASRDLPDERDWIYQPPPIPLKNLMNRPRALELLNQRNEGACTGFALAAVINRLNRERGRKVTVSPRMLYEMARKHDEWPGEDYPGSSCRGAIKGFANMGVCRDSYWPFTPGKPGQLSVRAAKDARNNTIGAYYRLRPRISDFHAALNQAGALLCSARVHDGWADSALKNGVIPLRKEERGGHAFALVGYNKTGFWVQNSWGSGWGRSGCALWRYEDWYQNLVDAWVLSLALPTPQIWHLGATPGQGTGTTDKTTARQPRGRIAGHFVHIDDGRFHDSGRYWSNLQDVQTTLQRLATSSKYDHLLLYAHGGLNSPNASADRIAHLRDVFKANRIYPFHFMYDTGLCEEIKDVVLRRGASSQERAGGFSDWWDRVVERVSRKPGRALWREMKAGARKAFEPGMAGTETLQAMVQALVQGDGLKLKLHLAGHSTGAILQAHLLAALELLLPTLKIESCSLLAPAATRELFESHYLPRLATPVGQFGIKQLTLYNLNDELEQDDNVAYVYRKSLLYLVSRAFEEQTPAPIIGMQTTSRAFEGSQQALTILYSQQSRTQSTSHGGFDNDLATMNDLLQCILGKKPPRPFTKSDLDY